MAHVLRGTLCGRVCADCPIPVSNVVVRVYRVEDLDQSSGLAAANPKLTTRLLSAAEVDAKADRLVGEGRTAEDGSYAIELTGENYSGGPVEVDLTVEAASLSGRESLEARADVSLTTLQPTWLGREDDHLVAAWDNCLSQRLWCRILEAIGLWVICGVVRDCETEAAVPGVVVTAFDTDWLQDDEIGATTTDGFGRFRIWYVKSDFTPTIFPGIDVELVGGPDLYFRVETSGGVVLLEEHPTRGRGPDREDVGNCFCVELCLEEPLDIFENPFFYQVGDFNIAADIDTVTGRTLHAKAGHAGPDWGFHGDLKLKGYCPKTLPSDPTAPMFYRFLYVDPANPGVEVPVTGGLVGSHELVVGARVVPWDQFGTGVGPTYQDIVIVGTGTPASIPNVAPAPPAGPAPHGPVPAHVLVPDGDGWIGVDQLAVDGGFQGPLMRLRSGVAFSDGSATSSGDLAGSAPATPRNGRVARIVFETATDPADPATINRQMLEAAVYINNWSEVRLLDLHQFLIGAMGSCTPITNDLDILYTVDHELLHGFALDITSASSATIPPLPSGSGPRGGNGTHHLDVSSWPSCSYTVRLSSRRSLTNGESDDPSNEARRTFCK